MIQAHAAPPAQGPALATERGHGRSSFAALVGGRTPLTPQEAAVSLSVAWRERFSVEPSAGTLALLLAQWALETGRGSKMHGHNFGGIKATASGEPSASLVTREGYGAEARRVHARFKTYATALEGARDYIATLAKRFPGTLPALRAADAGAFALALEHGRYFTGDPAAYRSGIVSLSREFLNDHGRLTVEAPRWLVAGVLSAFQLAMRRRT